MTDGSSRPLRGSVSSNMSGKKRICAAATRKLTCVTPQFPRQPAHQLWHAGHAKTGHTRVSYVYLLFRGCGSVVFS